MSSTNSRVTRNWELFYRQSAINAYMAKLNEDLHGVLNGAKNDPQVQYLKGTENHKQKLAAKNALKSAPTLPVPDEYLKPNPYKRNP